MNKTKEIEKPTEDVGYSEEFIKQEQAIERIFFGATTEELARQLQNTDET